MSSNTPWFKRITTKHKLVLFPLKPHTIVVQDDGEQRAFNVDTNQVVVIGPRRELQKDADIYNAIATPNNLQAATFLAIPPLHLYKPDSTWLNKDVSAFIPSSSSSLAHTPYLDKDVVVGITKRYQPIRSLPDILTAMQHKNNLSRNQDMPLKLIEKMIDSFVLDIICGMAIMSTNSYIHNDIKLYNIVYDQDTKRFKLMDFGNSLSFKDEEEFRGKMLSFNHANEANQVVFTYMNPVIQGLRHKKQQNPSDPLENAYALLKQADVWSLALIAYKLTRFLCQNTKQCRELAKNIIQQLLKSATLDDETRQYMKTLDVVSTRSRQDKTIRKYTLEHTLLQGKPLETIYQSLNQVLGLAEQNLIDYINSVTSNNNIQTQNSPPAHVSKESTHDNKQDPPLPKSSSTSATSITFATSPPVPLPELTITPIEHTPFPYTHFQSSTTTYVGRKDIQIAPFSIVVRPWRIHGSDENLQVTIKNDFQEGFFECILKVFSQEPDKRTIVNAWKTFKKTNTPNTQDTPNDDDTLPLLLFWTAKYFGICIRYIERRDKRNDYIPSIVVVPITGKSQRECMETSKCDTTFIYYNPPKKMTTIGVTITHEKQQITHGKGYNDVFTIAQYSNNLNKSIRKKLIKDIARENLACDYDKNGDVYQPEVDNIFQDGYIQLSMTPYTEPNTPLWKKLSNIKKENKEWLAQYIVTFFNNGPQRKSMHLVLWTESVTKAQIVACLQTYPYTILVEANLWYYVVFENIEGITTTTIVNIKRRNLETNIPEYKEEIKELLGNETMHISTIHDLINVCEITQDIVPFIICSLFFIEENITQQRRWWTWPNIIITIVKKTDNKSITYFTDFTKIQPTNSPNQLAWRVYNFLTQRSRTNIVESSSTSSSSSSPESSATSSEDARSPWLSCSPCLDCFAPKPKRKKRKHKAQTNPQERKRTRPSPPLQIDWRQAYCDLLGSEHNHGSAMWVKYTFRRKDTTGDGNCFFHAIIGSAKSFGSAHRLSGYKRSVKYIRKVHFGKWVEDVNEDRKKHLSTMGEWITTDDMQYIAEKLGICIFLYGPLGNNSHGWRIFNGTNNLGLNHNNVVYIYNNGQATSGNTSGTHFETLIRHDEEDFNC